MKFNPHKQRLIKAFKAVGWEPSPFPSTNESVLIMDIPTNRPYWRTDGTITINLERRWWSPGTNTHPRFCGAEPTWFGVGLTGYTGRGWPEKMVQDILTANANRLAADKD